jgi:hypothetical protein
MNLQHNFNLFLGVELKLSLLKTEKKENNYTTPQIEKLYQSVMI